MLWISEIPVFDLQRRFRNRRNGARMRFHCNYLSKRLLLQQNIISGAFRLINQGLIFMFLLVALRYVAASIELSSPLSLHLIKQFLCCHKRATFWKGNSYFVCHSKARVLLFCTLLQFLGTAFGQTRRVRPDGWRDELPADLGNEIEKVRVPHLCSTSTLQPWLIIYPRRCRGHNQSWWKLRVYFCQNSQS